MTNPLIVVHGGAGDWKDERIPIGVQHVKEAARVGYRVLENNGSALDAAEACTLYMESCGELNAGAGATRNEDGDQELDAMIIDGENLKFGAVASVKGIRNPISLARYVMEKTNHVMFAGTGAEILYHKMIEEGYRHESEIGCLKNPFEANTADTVGCVVLDSKNRMAATSSTGGIKNKIYGRVGDSPIFGSGAYANEVCSVSATGYGEHIMRVTLSRTVAQYIEEGMDIQEAADKGMNLFEKKTGSEAGLIALDSKGNWARSTNAKAMPLSVIYGSKKLHLSFDK